jgi:hypothetical protein
MSAHRRNAVSLPLALCAAVALSMSSAALAAEQPHRFVLTAYPTAAGGRALLAGRYRQAVRQLRHRAGGSALDAAAVYANRCVAFSMTLQWRAARAACDAAVRDARRERFETPLWGDGPHTTGDERLAAAYADRGVMRWFSHDATGAQKDFARARALSPYSGFVRGNLTAMKFLDTEAHARGS